MFRVMGMAEYTAFAFGCLGMFLAMFAAIIAFTAAGLPPRGGASGALSLLIMLSAGLAGFFGLATLVLNIAHRIEDAMLRWEIARWAAKHPASSVETLGPWPYAAPESLSLLRSLRPAPRDVLSLAILELVTVERNQWGGVAAKRLALNDAAAKLSPSSLTSLAELMPPQWIYLPQLLKDVKSTYGTFNDFVARAVMPVLAADGLIAGSGPWSMTPAGEAVRKDAQERVAAIFFQLRQDPRYAAWAGKDARKDLFAAVLALSAGQSLAGADPTALGSIEAALASAAPPESDADPAFGRRLDMVLADYDDRYRTIDSGVESSSGGGDSGDGDGGGDGSGD